MSYSYKCYSDTKDFMKKFVNAEEGAIIYGISKSRIIVIAREAGAVYKVGNSALINTELFEKYLERFREPARELPKHTWNKLKEMQMLQVLQWDGCRKETDYYEKSYGSRRNSNFRDTQVDIKDNSWSFEAGLRTCQNNSSSIRNGGKGISFIRKNGHILRGGERMQVKGLFLNYKKNRRLMQYFFKIRELV